MAVCIGRYGSMSRVLTVITIILLVFPERSTKVLPKVKEMDIGAKARNESENIVYEDTDISIDCDSCTGTGYEDNETTLQVYVNLTGEFDISRVEIFRRKECPAYKTSAKKKGAERSKSYQLFISNSPEYSSGTKCYQDSFNADKYPDLCQNDSCSGVGSFLIMFPDHLANETGDITICELEDNGCEQEKQGGGPEIDCDKNCLSFYCYPAADSRNCSKSNCKDWWRLDKCSTACPAGKYGPSCQEDCGNCFNSTSCDQRDGSCLGGCKLGWNGNRCDKKCRKWTYGKNCKKICDKCSEVCGHFSGTCPFGCVPGWRGDNCTDECEFGTYGKDCLQKCGNCYGNESCETTDGSCIDGCLDGWIGTNCNETCSNGKYGPDCHKDCGNCFNTNCDHRNGTCIDGCLRGWKGKRCDEICTNGTYGLNCLETCGNCNESDVCDPVNGICPNGCIDGWKEPMCKRDGTKATSSPNDAGSFWIWVGIGIVAVLLIILVVIVCVFTRKRRNSKNKRERSLVRSPSNAENDIEDSTAKFDDESTPGSDVSTGIENEVMIKINENDNTEINVSDIKQKSNPNILKEEFEALPKEVQFPCTAGELHENLEKNRYRNLHLYDHSMVKLSEIDGLPNSNYINASYINSCTKENAYIAAQGPLRNTVFDFWRMIWETSCGKIVCLTQMKECSKVKCTQYWPSKLNQTKRVEIFDIILQWEREYESFVISVLQAKNRETNEVRDIHHFYFITWPDQGTPNLLNLLQFHHLVTGTQTSLTGPDIVHCSAGVGRTGTYIAIDALLEEGKRSGVIDVFRFVQQMRNDRFGMVQNVHQYFLIHNTLKEGFLLDGSSLQKAEFQALWEAMQNENVQKNKHRCYIEYHKLHNVRPVPDAMYTQEAISDENKIKNRSSVLPDKRYRQYLYSYLSGRNDYINAVIMPSIMEKTAYLVTQYPLPGTVSDFWFLLYDTDSSVAVILEPNEEGVQLFPDEEMPLQFGPLTVSQCQAVTSSNGIDEREVVISKENDEYSKKVRIMEASCWTWGQELPPSTQLLNDLISKAKFNRNEVQNGPVTVVCRNGATKCGLFCTVANILETLQATDEINLMFAARQLQLRRPEFIVNVDQYEYCYSMVHQHLEHTTYMNVNP